LNNETVLFVGNIGLLVGMVFVLLFCVMYITRSAWKTTKTGRAIAWFVTSIAAILSFVTVVAFTGDFPGRIFIRFGLYWYFAVSSVILFVRLWGAQKRDNGVHSAQMPDASKENPDG
jgi:hypothetical protein